jgi:hypothetical protein
MVLPRDKSCLSALSALSALWMVTDGIGPNSRAAMNDFKQPSAGLAEVLLGYLQAEGALPWPGADGLTVDVVLAYYVEAARRGRVPGLEQLCRQHPHLADEVATFFAASAPADRPPAGP